MVSAESWEILEERALVIVRELNKDRDLLEVFSSAARESNSTDLRRRWERLISAVCRAIKGKWDGTAKRLEVADLAAFRAARSAINSDLEFPSLLATWRLLGQEFCEHLAAHPTFDEFDFRSVEELTRFSEEGRHASRVSWTRMGSQASLNRQWNGCLRRRGEHPAPSSTPMRRRIGKSLLPMFRNSRAPFVEYQGFLLQASTAMRKYRSTRWATGQSNLRKWRMHSARTSRTPATHTIQRTTLSGMKVHQSTNLPSAVFSLNSEALPAFWHQPSQGHTCRMTT